MLFLIIFYRYRFIALRIVAKKIYVRVFINEFNNFLDIIGKL